MTEVFTTPILFCFVAWMERYRGNPKKDVPRGGGAFIDENNYGYEIFNFRPVGSKLYGYVATRGIGIEKLNASPGSDSVQGVTVVFVAWHPELGMRVVVGWYTNATVYRQPQLPVKASDRSYRGEQLEYNLASNAADSFLLLKEDRNFTVPDRDNGGFGQSRLWYADQPQHKRFLAQISEYLQTREMPTMAQAKTRKGGPGWQQDLEKRLKVEQTAVSSVWKYFEVRGFDLKDVQKDCLGWDLEAVQGKLKLLLEVKGTSAAQLGCELTPNEYAAMTGSKKPVYRVCGVTNALANRPDPPRIFYWSPEQKCWTDGSQRLVFQELKAARVTVA